MIIAVEDVTIAFRKKPEACMKKTDLGLYEKRLRHRCSALPIELISQLGAGH